MTVRANARGASVRYLLQHAGCAAENVRSEPGLDYYLQPAVHGEPEGRWMGSGLEALGLHQGYEVEAETMTRIYEDLVHPETGESLGRRPRQFKSLDDRLAERLVDEPDAPPARVAELRRELAKTQREACHYYDVTFSAQKSVSVLYAALRAAGREDEAEGVWAAHRQGVAAAMAYLEQEAGYARVGYHGRTRDGRSVGEYVAARGWVAARFDHTTSRSGDPQLHSHVGVLNRVQREDTGDWVALDGRALYRAAKAAEGVYHLTMEETLQRTHNVEFGLRPDGKIREIIGIDEATLDAFSSRRTEVEEQVQTWASMYERRHGRPPSPYQLTVMYEKAVLSTRTEKEAPESAAVQNEQWTNTALDGPGQTLDEISSTIVQDDPVQPSSLDELDRPAIIRAAVQDVASRRTEWRRDELVAALYRQIPGRLDLHGDGVQSLLDGLADEAVSPAGGYGVVQLTAPAIVAMPEPLVRDADGRSRWEPHRYERYAVAEQIAAEERLYRGVRWDAPHLTMDGPVLPDGGRAASAASAVDELDSRSVDGGRLDGNPSTDVDGRTGGLDGGRWTNLDDPTGPSPGGGWTVLDEVDARIAAAGLDEQQAAAVRGVLTSPRSIDVIIGPAGAGKSRAMSTLQTLWEEYVGGQVLGLATSQRAAGVLEDEGLTALNISKFLQQYEPDENQRVRRWLSPSTLLVVDESGMSSTDQLDRVRAVANRYGAKTLTTGDHEQLDAVGPGGALRMLHRRLGGWELNQVHRFEQDWEREASLRIREGDADALVEYEQRGRLIGGTRDDMIAAAVEGQLGDTLAGKQALLIVNTNDTAAELSGYIRSRLVGLGRVDDSRTTELRDGNRVGAGDVIQLRRNDRKLVGQDGRGWAVNRDTYRVLAVSDDGGVTAEHTDTGARMQLPQEYLGQHVTLSYAVTGHSGQGLTVDVGRPLIEPGMSRQQGYPALTRGREANYAYVITHEEPSDDNAYERREQTAVEVMTEMLHTDGAQRAAVDIIEDELDQASSLAMLGVPWQTVVAEHSRDRAADALASVLSAEVMDQIVDENGAGRLWRACRTAELAGHDLTTVLPQVVAQRPLGDVDSVSDVLRWRLRQHTKHHPAPQAGREADTFAGRSAHGDDVVAATTRELAEAMDRRVQVLGERVADEPPDWAIEHLGPVPEDPTEREAWTRRAATVAAWREFSSREELLVPLGPAPSPEMPEMRAAWDRAWQALGRPEDQVDMYRADDAELEAIVARWQRQLEWAPQWIDDPEQPGTPLVVRTAQELHRYESRLTIAQAELGVAERAGDETEADALRQRIEQYTEIRDQLDRQVAMLDEIHTAHREWDEHTRDDWELARRARGELERRDNPDVQATDEQRADRDRWSELIAGAGGVELADTVRRSPAARALWARLEEAEAAGHNAEAILSDIVDERELVTARSEAATLSWRLDRWLEQHPDPEPREQPAAEEPESSEPQPEPEESVETEPEAVPAVDEPAARTGERTELDPPAPTEVDTTDLRTGARHVDEHQVDEPRPDVPELEVAAADDEPEPEIAVSDDVQTEAGPEQDRDLGPTADERQEHGVAVPSEADLMMALGQARAAAQRIEHERHHGRPADGDDPVAARDEAERERRESARVMDERQQAELEAERDRGYELEPVALRGLPMPNPGQAADGHPPDTHGQQSSAAFPPLHEPPHR